ncbi:MAG: hypothetical protein IKZ87_03930, partial [Actinomycetaceae bacterium]|nr:hypothetical protein [Actinomycetaceae bacterium]
MEEEKQSFVSRVGKPWIAIIAVIVVAAIAATVITTVKTLTRDTNSAPTNVTTENTAKPVQGKGTQENLVPLSDKGYHADGDVLAYNALSRQLVLKEQDAFISRKFNGEDKGINGFDLTRQPFPYIQETAPNGMQYMHVEGLGPYFISDKGIPCGYPTSYRNDNARMLQAINYTLLMYQAKTVDEKKAIIEVYTDMSLDGKKVTDYSKCNELGEKAPKDPSECVIYGKTYESVYGRGLIAQLEQFSEAYTVKKDDYYPTLHLVGFSMEKNVQENEVDGDVYSVFFKFGDESAVYRSDFIYPTIHLGNDESRDSTDYLHPISG